MSSRSRSCRTDKPASPARTSMRQTWSRVGLPSAFSRPAASSSFIEDSVKPGMSRSHQVFRGIAKAYDQWEPPTSIAPPPDMHIQLFSMGDAPFIGRAGTRLLESGNSSIVCCFKITAHRQCARSSACSEARPRTRWTVFHAMKLVRESVSANQMHCLEMFGVDLQDCNEIDG